MKCDNLIDQMLLMPMLMINFAAWFGNIHNCREKLYERSSTAGFNTLNISFYLCLSMKNGSRVICRYQRIKRTWRSV